MLIEDGLGDLSATEAGQLLPMHYQHFEDESRLPPTPGTPVPVPGIATASGSASRQRRISHIAPSTPTVHPGTSSMRPAEERERDPPDEPRPAKIT
eukprot:4414757-Amphidinium_carterae.1